MTDEEMRSMVKECGLDWHRGYVPLFDGDPTNRYAVLIEAVAAAEREECAKLCEKYERMCSAQSDKNPWRYAAGAIRARSEK